LAFSSGRYKKIEFSPGAKGLGGYSHSADPTDEAAWELLLKKFAVAGLSGA
jgi:hypothetical protein